MKIYAVVANLQPNSFCNAILNTAIDEAKKLGHTVVSHDLYVEKFDPVLTKEEVSAKNEDLEPIIKQHIDEVLEADAYIIIHPNWWGQPPAVLKGWIDRVLRQGEMYAFTEDGPVGYLTDKKALILNTSNTPQEIEDKAYGDPLDNLWKNCIFALCGTKDVHRENFTSVILSDEEQRKGWLEKTRELVRGL